MLRRSLLVSAFALTAVGAFAGNDVVNQILTNNIELKSAQKSFEADAQGVRAENNFADPEVEFSYTFDKPDDSFEISVTEGIEWPGVYAARKRMAKHQISAFEYIYKAKLMEVKENAMLILADLTDVNKRINQLNFMIDKERELYKFYSSKEAEGELTIIELNSLRLDLFDVEAELKDLLIRKNVLLEDLKAMNGGVGVEVDNAFNSYNQGELLALQHYVDSYKANSPEYQATVQKRYADKQAVKVATMGAFPNFALGYKFSKEGSASNHGLIVGMSIPLFSSRHKRKVAQRMHEASEFAVANQELVEVSKIGAQYASLLSLQEMIAEFRPIADNDAIYRSLDKALEAGQLSMRDYLIEMRQLKSAKMRLFDMEYNYQTALISISKYNL